MRLAMRISPSRVSSPTVPLPRMYMRTRTAAFDAGRAPAGGLAARQAPFRGARAVVDLGVRQRRARAGGGLLRGRGAPGAVLLAQARHRGDRLVGGGRFHRLAWMGGGTLLVCCVGLVLACHGSGCASADSPYVLPARRRLKGWQGKARNN